MSSLRPPVPPAVYAAAPAFLTAAAATDPATGGGAQRAPAGIRGDPGVPAGAGDVVAWPDGQAAVALPNGRVLRLLARGLHWMPHANFGSVVCVAVDSCGRVDGRFRWLALDATAAEFDAAEADLRRQLDEADPPRLRLTR